MMGDGKTAYDNDHDNQAHEVGVTRGSGLLKCLGNEELIRGFRDVVVGFVAW
jgi:hypothetical protein